MANEMRFAGYPSAHVYDRPGGTRKRPHGKPVQHLLWGDWLELRASENDGWVKVRARRTDGYMHKDSFQEKRLLEVVFVDIGQGDGALVVTPDDKHLLVDAGQEANMFRFLRWRYGRFREPFTFEAAVITHPDMDHYKGFTRIFADANVRVNAIYHNGIVERTGKDTLGPRTPATGGKSWLTDIVLTEAELRALLGPEANRGRKLYPNLLFKALESGRMGTARALSVEDGHLPGFAPGNASGVEIEVLAPILERDGAGAPRLRWLGDNGLTKNGHSVVLRLKYGEVSILLGGDLNTPSEHLLLEHHTGMAVPPDDEDASAFIAKAREHFRSDIAKACHHGSADFTDLFLQAVDPVATVVSSGDDESHCHPRPDALGATGRFGRGRRPLIFSTELARSAPEMIEHPVLLKQQIEKAYSRLHDADTDKARERARAEINALMAKVDRSVAVFGAIQLRTDGERVVLAQKLEKVRSAEKKWEIYALQKVDGEFQYVARDYS